MEVTRLLCAEMMRLGGLVQTKEEALPIIENAILSGEAFAAFRQLVIAQEGDISTVDQQDRLPRANICHPFHYEGEKRAYVSSINALDVGQLVARIGAGRARADALIDPSVGLYFHKKVGDPVVPGDLVCELHLNDVKFLEVSLQLLRSAIVYAESKPDKPDIVIDMLSGN